MYQVPQYGYPQSYIPIPPPDLRRMQEEEKLRKIANRAGIAVLCYYGLMFAIQMLLLSLLSMWGLVDYSQVSNAFQGIEPLAYYLMTGVCATVSAVLPAALLLRSSREGVHALLPFASVGKRKMASYVVMGLSVCMFANFATTILSNNLSGMGIPEYAASTPFDGSPISVLMLILCVCVVPALMEELVFRGAILGSLRRFGDGVAILGSAGLFGVMHGNLVQIPFAFIVGLILGYLVVHTGSMLPAILVHFFNNLCSCLMVIFGFYLDAHVYNIFSYILVILIFVIGMLGFCYLSKRDRGLFTLSPKRCLIPFSGRLGIFVGSPAVIAFLVVMAIMTLLTIVGGMML